MDQKEAQILFLKFVPLMLLLGSIYFLISGIGNALDFSRLIFHGVSTTGTIVDFEEKHSYYKYTMKISFKSGNHKRIRSDSYFLPKVQFKDEEGKIIEFYGMLNPLNKARVKPKSGIGRQVPVLYDPALPDKAIIDLGIWNWGDLILPFLVSGIFLSCYFSFMKQYPLKKSTDSGN